MRRAPDVAVIGGGIAGTSAAAFLAASGARVRLYERESIAAGASGRNSGIVQHPFDPVLADLYRRTVDAYRDLGAGSDASFHLPDAPSGLLFVGRDPDRAADHARQWAAAWPATAPEVLEGSRLRALEPSLAPDLAACRVAIGYPVAPAAATQAFATLAERSGVEIVIGDEATVETDGDRVVGVRLRNGLEPSGAVVVAAGPATPAVIDPTGRWRPIDPIWGVVASVALDRSPRHGLEAIDITVEPAEAPDRAGPDDGGIEEPLAELVEFSLVPSTSSCALGSTFLASEPDGPRWVDALRRVGARYVPAVASAPLVGVRQCARPVSRDGRPLVGRAPWARNLWVIAGHGPWGISTGPGSARLLVDAIVGDSTLPDALAVGRFGTPLAQRQEFGSVR
jgi:glycine/D-amino acid oxidase-like deaminating enzyme